jgi:hypothetical protein
MLKTIHPQDLPRRFAAVMSAATLAASLLALPVTARATPTDKRKPGLYWTFETDKGKISCKLFEAEAPVTVRTMVGLAIGKLSYVNPDTKQAETKKFSTASHFIA